MSYSQPEELEAYFKQKAEQEKQEQAKRDAEQQKEEELSAYEACVLKESARVKELIAQAQNKTEPKD